MQNNIEISRLKNLLVQSVDKKRVLHILYITCEHILLTYAIML